MERLSLGIIKNYPEWIEDVKSELGGLASRQTFWHEYTESPLFNTVKYHEYLSIVLGEVITHKPETIVIYQLILTIKESVSFDGSSTDRIVLTTQNGVKAMNYRDRISIMLKERKVFLEGKKIEDRFDDMDNYYLHDTYVDEVTVRLIKFTIN